MKWSDGEAFTTDDFVFWYEDITMNPKLPPPCTLWQNGKIEKVDDYTVRVAFTSPMPSFLVKMQKGDPINCLWAAKHYLQTWHIKYNPDADKLAKEEGYESWGFASRLTPTAARPAPTWAPTSRPL